jgi:hypothetical protein
MLVWCRNTVREWIHVFPLVSDEHRAFCDGRMPGWVYADYLEELYLERKLNDLDPRVLKLLRKEVTECRTKQPC